MDIKIIVAAHKPYRMPEDSMYVPVQAGAAMHDPIDGYPGDNTGDNIGEKNPLYCELTCIYWAWKNLEADYLGLAHYRRHFSIGGSGDKWQKILTKVQAENLLQKADVVLPQKRFYVIETLYSHYAHSHYAIDLDTTKAVIADICPEYSKAFDDVMKRRSAHMFNMCIMKRELLDDYLTWMFGVLKVVEERLDISSYSDFDKRVFGRISELLMDVWITKNNVNYVEANMMNMDGENWPKKIALFIKRKLGLQQKNG
ncbi:MAG: DUF4422 domain-containing protein [Lachnospiraceae bacterium]|nr:DUF4422 domain-containing protein [Lachnospiraceae bacterium]